MPFTKYELSKIESFGLSGKVKHIIGDDQLLADLYNSAQCHVITSKYEGFGMTATEPIILIVQFYVIITVH